MSFADTEDDCVIASTSQRAMGEAIIRGDGDGYKPLLLNDGSGIVTREVSGHGVCAFAARSFKPGDLVIQESAIVLSTVSAKDHGRNRDLWQALVRAERGRSLPAFEPSDHLGAMVAMWDLDPNRCREVIATHCLGLESDFPTLAEARREATVLRWALRDGALQLLQRPTHSKGWGAPLDAVEYDRLRRVIRFNGFRYNFDCQEGESGYDVGEALFEKVSRINHSCAPNLAHELFWCEENGTVVIRMTAATHIPLGEELCISYLQSHLTLSLMDRQRFFTTQWKFKCDCRRCIAEGGPLPTGHGVDTDVKDVVARQPTEHICRSEQERGDGSADDDNDHASSSSSGFCWDDLRDPDVDD